MHKDNHIRRIDVELVAETVEEAGLERVDVEARTKQVKNA